MVMEANKASPHIVGREFVRQYYTLLHNAPDHLHRFYNQHSSFIHGGLDPNPENPETPLVIGQKNIHDKIQQLNFRDCHAKISHVDAQATLGDGVVVQVSGELSNDGHPMRRFTQTFVLASQSPKKYYVHNDIFRYQDMYQDDEDQVVRTEQEEHESDSQTNPDSSSTIMVQQPAVYYPTNVGMVNNNVGLVNGVVMHDEILKNISTQTIANQSIPVAIQQPAAVVASLPMAPTPVSVPMPIEPVVVPEHIIPLATAVTVSVQADIKESNQYLDAEISTGEDSESMDNSKDNTPTSMASSAPSKPPSFSYANLVKQGPNTIFAPAPQNDLAMSQPTPSFQAVTAQQQKFQHAEANAERNADRNPGGNQRAPASRPVREQRDQRDQRERKTSNSNYADSSCQLFLGNLPTKATEDQLREMFSIYGRVTELRVHANPTQKNPSQRPVKNYGFITFEDQQSVNNLLNAPSIYFPVIDDPSGQKLNVERKFRKDTGNGPQGSNGGGPRPQTNGGPNMDRGRNSNLGGGGGMNRNGSGQRDRGDRDSRGNGNGGGRDGGNRQFNRSERGSTGPRNGNGTGGPSTGGNSFGNNNTNNNRR
ncbi:unnamed protein product [Diamesa hyperborea]